jgi:hypothetical protein
MIKEFKGEYRWLSNFALSKIIIKGIEYITVEHAYQAAKNNSPEWKELCRTIEKPREVRDAGQEVEVIPDWESKKLGIMRFCIEQKFDQEPYKTLLLETGDQELQEGNNWHDTFWGVDLNSGVGQNNLGKLIMEKRKTLRTLF